MSGGVVDAMVCRANGNVPEAGRVYNSGRGERSANGHRRQGGRGAIDLFGTGRMCARILLLRMRLRTGEMVVGSAGASCGALGS
jgi:hypothetical protein